mmetsp:Transcript_34456/g.60445  ORF Transcript_34456/g.60445 Transcript_34456/m.60445 type:complete len:263 (+) Transcript_34456:3-791(+)
MDFPTCSECAQLLHDKTQPLSQRMRSIFYLRTIGTEEAAEALKGAYPDPSDLLSHELMYVIGQLGFESSTDFLEGVLRDETQSTIVRHEAAEALGALGYAKSRPVLEEFKNVEDKELAETCVLALDRLNWLETQEVVEPSHIPAVDPAPPMPKTVAFEDLVAKLNDPSLSMFIRYRALFALRDLGTTEAIVEMSKGLSSQNFSPLFRHEIAFVMGQLGETAVASVPYLMAAIDDTSNHEIVRHESAESLAAVSTSAEVIEFL